MLRTNVAWCYIGVTGNNGGCHRHPKPRSTPVQQPHYIDSEHAIDIAYEHLTNCDQEFENFTIEYDEDADTTTVDIAWETRHSEGEDTHSITTADKLGEIIGNAPSNSHITVTLHPAMAVDIAEIMGETLTPTETIEEAA